MNKTTGWFSGTFAALAMLTFASSGVRADDFWLYDASSRCISKDGAVVGVLPVAGAERELMLATGSTSHTKTYPSDGVLDFSFEVRDGDDNVWTITEMAQDAYKNEPQLKEMVLPSTLRKIGVGEFNGNAATAPVISPKFPAGLVDFGDSSCRTMRFGDETVSIGSGGGDVTIGDSCFALGGSAYTTIAEIEFGTGLVTMTKTDVFYGRRVKTIRIGGDLKVGSSTFNGMAGYVTRIFVPATAVNFLATLDGMSQTAWKDDPNQQSYFDVHGEGARTPDYRVTFGSVAVWIVLETPTTDKGTVTVTGEKEGVTACLGTANPSYNSLTEYELKDLPLAFTADATATAENVRYACRGCRLDKKVEGVWQAVETKADVHSYSFAPADQAAYRVVWLWETEAYKCDVTLPDGYSDVLSVETTGVDADGYAAAGATVTLRAVSTDPAIPFCFWTGDVAEGDRKNAEISFVQTGATSFFPYFKTPWTWSGSASQGCLTDGYWTICVTGELPALTVAKNDPDSEPSTMWAGGYLDLAKTITGGGAIVALGDDAFHWCTELREIVLPDTLTAIGSYALYTKSSRLGDSRLTGVTPCLPSGVVTLGQYALANSNGNAVKLGGELVWRPKTEATLGLEQQFGDQGFSKVTLGKNVRRVTPYMFVRCTAIQELYFEGDVPTFENMNAFNGWSSGQATVYVPRGNASWQQWLSEHAGDLPSGWKEVRTFNAAAGFGLFLR